MIPKVAFDDILWGSYCDTMCLVRQGLAGDCWNPCKTLKKCCEKDCECIRAKEECDRCLCIEDMWWYDPHNPCSEEFQGVIINDMQVTAAYSRETKETLSGGSIGNLKFLPVEITFEFFIVASTEGGTQYGIDILSQLGARRACFEDCIKPELRISTKCGDCEDIEEFDVEAAIGDGFVVRDIHCVHDKEPIGKEMRFIVIDDQAGTLEDLMACYPPEDELECGCSCLVDLDKYDEAIAAYQGGDLTAGFFAWVDAYETSTETIAPGRDTTNWLANFETVYGFPWQEQIADNYVINDITCEVKATSESCSDDITTACSCPTCKSDAIYKNVLPLGPVIEKESSLRRCCGTLAEWTFVAEVPYKFFDECKWKQLPTLGTQVIPNWCPPEDCLEEDCVDSGPIGEEGVGILSTVSIAQSCYCDPIFHRTMTCPIPGHDVFSTFVNWRLTATEDMENISVCWLPDLGDDPMQNPGLYICERPVVTTIGKLNAGDEVVLNSPCNLLLVNDEIPGGNVSWSTIKQECDSGWLTIKSDVCNDEANDSLTMEVQTVRASL